MKAIPPIRSAHPIHDISPSFEWYTLKDSEHRQSEIIEVRDSIVGTSPRWILDAHLEQINWIISLILSRWTGPVKKCWTVEFYQQTQLADSPVLRNAVSGLQLNAVADVPHGVCSFIANCWVFWSTLKLYILIFDLSIELMFMEARPDELLNWPSWMQFSTEQFQSDNGIDDNDE